MPLRIYLVWSQNEVDKPLIDAFTEHCKPLVDDGIVELAGHHTISYGASVDQEAARLIFHADIVLPLISPSFIASPSCRKELQLALHLRQSQPKSVALILLRACDWQPVPELQARLAFLGLRGPIRTQHGDTGYSYDDKWKMVMRDLRALILADHSPRLPEAHRRLLERTQPTSHGYMAMAPAPAPAPISPVHHPLNTGDQRAPAGGVPRGLRLLGGMVLLASTVFVAVKLAETSPAPLRPVALPTSTVSSAPTTAPTRVAPNPQPTPTPSPSSPQPTSTQPAPATTATCCGLPRGCGRLAPEEVFYLRVSHFTVNGRAPDRETARVCFGPEHTPQDQGCVPLKSAWAEGTYRPRVSVFDLTQGSGLHVEVTAAGLAASFRGVKVQEPGTPTIGVRALCEGLILRGSSPSGSIQLTVSLRSQ